MMIVQVLLPSSLSPIRKTLRPRRLIHPCRSPRSIILPPRLQIASSKQQIRRTNLLPNNQYCIQEFIPLLSKHHIILHSKRPSTTPMLPYNTGKRHQAFVDLSALDQTLASGVAGEQLQTLGPPPDYWCLVHPKFAPYQSGVNWNDEIRAKRDAYIAAATAAA